MRNCIWLVWGGGMRNCAWKVAVRLPPRWGEASKTRGSQQKTGVIWRGVGSISSYFPQTSSRFPGKDQLHLWLAVLPSPTVWGRVWDVVCLAFVSALQEGWVLLEASGPNRPPCPLLIAFFWLQCRLPFGHTLLFTCIIHIRVDT
jgi:hypothetical protein